VDIIVRDLLATDLSAVARLNTELTGEATLENSLRERFERLVHWPGQGLFIAESIGTVAGFAHAQLRLALHEECSAELTALVVSTACRRTGCGTALVAAAEHWARTNGARRLALRSRADRHEAHKFYLRLGFEESSKSYKFTKIVA
jgi:GNAT superfamily N-acetyltransferase